VTRRKRAYLRRAANRAYRLYPFRRMSVGERCMVLADLYAAGSMRPMVVSGKFGSTERRRDWMQRRRAAVLGEEPTR